MGIKVAKPSVGNLILDGDNKPLTVIVDASGLTISKKGDCIEEKYSLTLLAIELDNILESLDEPANTASMIISIRIDRLLSPP